jgi:hypothetical protein
MNRKQRRRLDQLEKKQKGSDHKLMEQMIQFDKLPDECLTCLSPFDKKSKQMAMTWNVVVKDSDTVRLYCPDCWSMARRVAAEYIKEKQNAS